MGLREALHVRDDLPRPDEIIDGQAIIVDAELRLAPRRLRDRDPASDIPHLGRDPVRALQDTGRGVAEVEGGAPGAQTPLRALIHLVEERVRGIARRGGEAGGHQRLRGRPMHVDDRRPVAEGTFGAEGEEELVEGRRADDAKSAASLLDPARGDSPLREPVREVDGPVEGIDRPAGGGERCRRRLFLRADRPPRLGEATGEELIDLEIDRGDEIAQGALPRDGVPRGRRLGEACALEHRGERETNLVSCLGAGLCHAPSGESARNSLVVCAMRSHIMRSRGSPGRSPRT